MSKRTIQQTKNLDELINLCEKQLEYGEEKDILIAASDRAETYKVYKDFINCLRKCGVNVPDYTVYYTGNRIFRTTMQRVEVLPDSGDLTNAFYECQSLVEAVLPDGLQKIGNGAFSSCSKLSRVNIPSSVKEIGSTAFDSCAFKEIIIPENVEIIGNWSFAWCKQAEKIVVQNPNIVIGNCAFSVGSVTGNNSKLRQMVVPKSYKDKIHEITLFDEEQLNKIDISFI